MGTISLETQTHGKAFKESEDRWGRWRSFLALLRVVNNLLLERLSTKWAPLTG
jgi:hypothetical protein